MTKLTANQRIRIMAASGLAHATIRRIERGQNVTDASMMRYERGCREAGLEHLLASIPAKGDAAAE